MTKFYLVKDTLSELKDYYAVINFNNCEDFRLIKNDKIHKIDSFYYEWNNYFDGDENSIGIDPCKKFLKSKHIFIFTRKVFGIMDVGFNIFDLSNEDLMYMRLIDCIK